MANYRDKWFANNAPVRGWYKCAKCGKKLRKKDVDIDHIIPKKYGGRDNLNNLQCMCKHCNRSKKSKMGVITIRYYTKNSIKNVFKRKKK